MFSSGTVRIIAKLVSLFASLLGTSAAAELRISLQVDVLPENVEIYQGDKVVREAQGSFLDVESYTGEWKSPVLDVGESYSFAFTNVGTLFYRSVWYNGASGPLIGNKPGSIRGRALDGPRPAVSIVSPPGGFAVHEFTLIEALVTNAAAEVEAVQFFRGKDLLDTVTNAPYRTRLTAPAPGNYEFTAVVVDRTGRTNVSPPIALTILAPRDLRVFNPVALPGGLFAFNYSLWNQRPPIPRFSTDLNSNAWYDAVGYRGVNLIIVDLTHPRLTNATSAFFKVDPAPL